LPSTADIVGGAPDVFEKAMSAYIRDVRETGQKNNLEIEQQAIWLLFLPAACAPVVQRLALRAYPAIS